MINSKLLCWAAAFGIATLFLWLRFDLSPDWINVDENIAIAVSKSMLAHDNLDANWALASELPSDFRFDQYNFYSYNMLAHAVLMLFGYQNGIVTLRLLNMILQSAAIVLVVLAMKNQGLPRWQRLLTAAMLSVTPALVEDAHIARTESFLYFLLAVVVWCASIEKSRLAFLAAGVAIGVGAAAKITFLATGLVLAPATFALTLRRPASGLLSAALILTGSALGFAAGAPYVLVNSGAYMSGLHDLFLQYGTEHPPHSEPTYHVWHGIRHLLAFVLILYGPLIGIAAVVDYRRAAHWLGGLALMSIAILVYFALKPVFFERNISLALFGLVVLGGSCLRDRVGLVIVTASAVFMVGWSLPIAMASRSPNHRRLEWQETRVGDVPVTWPWPDSVAQLRSCQGILGIYDYGDRYSHEFLKSAVDAGFYPMAHYVSAFHIVPTSTLQTYLDADVVYFFCHRAE